MTNNEKEIIVSSCCILYFVTVMYSNTRKEPELSLYSFWLVPEEVKAEKEKVQVRTCCR